MYTSWFYADATFIAILQNGSQIQTPYDSLVPACLLLSVLHTLPEQPQVKITASHTYQGTQGACLHDFNKITDYKLLDANQSGQSKYLSDLL
jgi:hypothetical protein